MSTRLPAHLKISALIRAVGAAGGFATVVSSGERDAGTILILTTERDNNARLWERMPNLDGSRGFTCVRTEEPDKKEEFSGYLARRCGQDPDTWLVELEIANPERFIETMVT